MNISNMSPEDISDFIFYELPADPCTINIIPITFVEENQPIAMVFEILITIYMEAILDAERLYIMLQSKQHIPKDMEPKSINMDGLNSDTFLLCEPWFRSFGFAISINECDSEYYMYDNMEYCRIILNNGKYSEYFKSNRILKKYHFMLCKNFVYKNDLSKIKAIFIKPQTDTESEKIYTIKFIKIN